MNFLLPDVVETVALQLPDGRIKYIQGIPDLEYVFQSDSMNMESITYTEDNTTTIENKYICSNSNCTKEFTSITHLKVAVLVMFIFKTNFIGFVSTFFVYYKAFKICVHVL